MDKMEVDETYESPFFKLFKQELEKIDRKNNRIDYNAHVSKKLDNVRKLERKMILVQVAEKYKDALYTAFAKYEELKTFIDLDLDYSDLIFVRRKDKLKRALRGLQDRLVAPPDDDGVFMDSDEDTNEP